MLGQTVYPLRKALACVRVLVYRRLGLPACTQRNIEAILRRVSPSIQMVDSTSSATATLLSGLPSIQSVKSHSRHELS